jgi:hypothetical protein
MHLACDLVLRALFHTFNGAFQRPYSGLPKAPGVLI